MIYRHNISNYRIIIDLFNDYYTWHYRRKKIMEDYDIIYHYREIITQLENITKHIWLIKSR